MREHDAWEGSSYKEGINGQRVLLVGWSHWGDEAEDVGTIGCIENVISGKWHNIRFFNQIRDYFSNEEPAVFWQQVAFCNFLPTLVGDGGQRFGHGTEEQRRLGRERFLRLIEALQPDKTFVLTSRKWAFPKVENAKRLGDCFGKFSRCEYVVSDHKTKAYFLRHTQGASKELMTRAVRHVLRCNLIDCGKIMN